MAKPDAPVGQGRMAKYAFPGKRDAVAADIAAKYGDGGDLVSIFTQNTGPIVHKWHHYLPIYDRYFGPWRGKPVRFLEIGVSKGGSLQMWRRFLGPDAVLFGIDIDPACAAFDGAAGQVRIGSQADPAFLLDVVAEMGGIDVVLDDGSHMMDHVRISLQTLLPHLTFGGTYMIEDLHTAYWNKFGGGIARQGNFFNDVRGIIDDMHHWYHDAAQHDAARAAMITGIHVHDSIVVLDKGPVFPPAHSRIGS